MGKEYEEIKAEISVRISTEDIDDIVTTALEGGICYWCRRAEVKGSISENLHRSRSAEEESWYCMIRWMARREN